MAEDDSDRMVKTLTALASEHNAATVLYSKCLYCLENTMLAKPAIINFRLNIDAKHDAVICLICRDCAKIEKMNPLYIRDNIIRLHDEVEIYV